MAKSKKDKNRTRKVVQSVRINGVNTTIGMEAIFWDALDQIAANTNIKADNIIEAFVTGMSRNSVGMKACTVRVGIIRFFREAQKPMFTPAKTIASLKKLTDHKTNPVEFGAVRVKVAKDEPIIEPSMPTDYCDALKEMDLPKRGDTLFVGSLVSRETYAWTSSQIGVEALKHYHTKARARDRDRFTPL